MLIQCEQLTYCTLFLYNLYINEWKIQKNRKTASWIIKKYKFASVYLYFHNREEVTLLKKTYGIKVGIGFATGRKSFQQVLKTNVHSWSE